MFIEHVRVLSFFTMFIGNDEYRIVPHPNHSFLMNIMKITLITYIYNASDKRQFFEKVDDKNY